MKVLYMILLHEKIQEKKSTEMSKCLSRILYPNVS